MFRARISLRHLPIVFSVLQLARRDPFPRQFEEEEEEEKISRAPKATDHKEQVGITVGHDLSLVFTRTETWRKCLEDAWEIYPLGLERKSERKLVGRGKVLSRVRKILSRCYPRFAWIRRCTLFASYRRVLHRQWTIQRRALQYAVASLSRLSPISYALAFLSIGKYFVVKHRRYTWV